MNSVSLPPPEFWFYRVYSELTLSLLHQVNNELTGVVFLTELIQEDMEAGAPAGDKFRDLHVSIEKVIRLTKQTMDSHLPLSAEPGEPPRDLGALLQEGIPFLRLVLPKTIAVRMGPHSSCAAEIPISKNDFQLVLAAVGLLLSPGSSRSPGELVITVEPSGAAVVFLPSYPAAGLTAETENHPESSAAFLALDHRLRRLGGSLGVFRNPDEAGSDALRLAFAVTT